MPITLNNLDVTSSGNLALVATGATSNVTVTASTLLLTGNNVGNFAVSRIDGFTIDCGPYT